MNQKYIDTVKTAHKLCKEMAEMDSKSAEFAIKSTDYIKFALESDDGNWYIPVYIMKLALSDYRLEFDAEREISFEIFSKKYLGLMLGMTTDSEKKYFLSEDLLYLRDIHPDQT